MVLRRDRKGAGGDDVREYRRKPATIVSLILVSAALVGCGTRTTAPLPSATDGLAARSSRSAYDPNTMDLAAVPPVVLALDVWDSHILAVRVHEAVVALEVAADQTDTRPEVLLERLQMHALAAQLANNSEMVDPGFRDRIGGMSVELHDLRSAHLLAASPGLAEIDAGPVVRIRAPYVEALMEEMERRPALADTAAVLLALGVPAE